MEQKIVLHWEEMYHSFLEELTNVKTVSLTNLESISNAIGISQKYLASLKREFLAIQSIEKEQEIEFFKTIKPRILSHYIFSRKQFNIELQKPVGALHILEEYYLKHFFYVTLFFEEHSEIYRYFRTKEVGKDEQYFIRQNSDKLSSFYTSYPNADPQFTTEHDYTFAKIIAYEMLAKYLQEALANLRERQVADPAQNNNDRKLIWTASKIAFIETIYAFKAAAVFNNGTATIKMIAEQLGKMLGIDPGNTSRSAQELLAREKGLTVFLDFLKLKLQQWSDELHNT